MAGLVRGPPRLAEQLLPLVIGQAFAVPVRPGVFAPVVEEADVVDAPATLLVVCE